MEQINFLLFCTTALALIATPGPDMLYVATRSLTQGKAIGLVSMLGICAGYLVHTCFAMMGLSAILQASEVLLQHCSLVGCCLPPLLINPTIIEIASCSKHKQ
ncbi:LysE family transporter [Oculatella sp. FACHB-28]|nr:LysE family transporter [Oculatella sp. FACHB-28]MBD2068634.1 LysE family transporter [Leptolyngbya sp. FACHB-671]